METSMEVPYYIADPGISKNADLVTVFGNSWLDQPWVSDPNTREVPGLESTAQAVQPAPEISTAQRIWNTIKSDSQSALQAVENGIKKTYSVVKEGVGTVVSDVTSPIESKITNTYVMLLIGVVVVAGAIYFIGKSGAVKVHAVV